MTQLKVKRSTPFKYFFSHYIFVFTGILKRAIKSNFDWANKNILNVFQNLNMCVCVCVYLLNLLLIPLLHKKKRTKTYTQTLLSPLFYELYTAPTRNYPANIPF